MVKIKVKLKVLSEEKSRGRIYYQIIMNKFKRQIETEYELLLDEWDSKNELAISEKSYNSDREIYIAEVNRNIEFDIKRIEKIIYSFGEFDSFNIDDIVKKYLQPNPNEKLFDFMQTIISSLHECMQYRTSETYKSTLASIMRFREGRDIFLVDLSSDIVLGYESYLKRCNVTMNTCSFYMRIFRAVYNRAVERNLIVQQYPFKKVYTGVAKTVKRSLTIEDIRQIKQLNLSGKPALELARDMFMFSFYTRGMSFIDIVYLQRTNISNGILSYRRRKTGQKLYIRWEECMQDIINCYKNETSYLFLVNLEDGKLGLTNLRSTQTMINRNLKLIAKLLSIDIPLTLYVARHTWANIAYNQNVPISIISEGMGHNSEKTTRIYLSSIENSKIDNINSLIIGLL